MRAALAPILLALALAGAPVPSAAQTAPQFPAPPPARSGFSGPSFSARPFAPPVPFPEERRTNLVSLRQGGQRSTDVRSLRPGGYELSDGTRVRFRDWYSSDWEDLSILLLTQVTPDFGILWGVSTGESGPKYRIDPSLRLGFTRQWQVSPNAFLTLTASTILGGSVTEETCTADYGAIGGVQEVNCRLAASTLAPSETLQYLLDVPPYDRHVVTLSYRWNF
ncbi:hypothetical protein [Frigidibacter oleivorans]|uniref:hypothetical protein n=1 Tax=Frigidibacter oleivorans TaxID=2487129 RepID=UPI000F8E7818|nr:hypothetical protein [Frigidibacter oleivorans]